MKALRNFFCICLLVILMTGCSAQQPAEALPTEPPSTEIPLAETQPQEKKEPLVNLMVRWRDWSVFLGQIFGTISDSGKDMVQVYKDNDPVGVIIVRSEDPETLRAEMGSMGQIVLQKLKPFEGKSIGFIVTYRGNDYTFYCHDESWSTEENAQTANSSTNYPDEETAEFMKRQYTDAELQTFVDDKLSFKEACKKISTVADAIQYMYLRGYHFEPDNAGIDAATRYQLNSGACVGGSALFNALLEGDYDAQGYVYIFYARSEHVFNYYVSDGVYYFCDFVRIFHDQGEYPEKSPIHHITTDPTTIYDAWMEIEPHDMNDPKSDFYLATMYTTAYHGKPTMPRTRLKDTKEGTYAHIPLKTDERESQQILFMREGYTFKFK